MSLLLRASLRHYLRHPWQLLFAIIGIMLGVAVFTAVDLAGNSAKRAFALSMDSITGSASHQIVGGPGGLDEAVYTGLRLNGWRMTAPLVEAYGSAGGETLHLLGVDPLAEGSFRDHLTHVRGDDTSALITQAGTGLLAAVTARRLAIEAGDDLELRLGNRMHRVRIIGLIEAGDDHGAAVDGLLVTDIATAQEFAGMIGKLSWIDVRLDDDGDPAQQLARIRALLPPDAEIVPAAARTHALSQMSAAFHTNLTAMSLLALIVGMFLIYNTMSFAVVQRRGLIASQRLIGVTRREVMAATLFEAVLIGVSGTALGLLAGVALGQALLGLVTRTINDLYFVITVTTLHIDAGPLAIAVTLGIGATLLAACAPAIEAASTPPGSARQRSTIEARSRRLMPRLAIAGVAALILASALLAAPSRSLLIGFAGLFLIILGMTFLTPLITVGLVRLAQGLTAPCSIAIRHAIRGIGSALSRTGVALAALMLAVATTIGVGLMIDSFRITVADWLEASLQADIYVASPGFGTRRSLAAMDPELVERLVSLPGIADHSTGRSISIEGADGFTDVFVLGLSPGLTPRYPLRAADPAVVWPAIQRGEAVLISEPMAWHRDLAPGDEIELRTRRGLRSFPIAAIYYDYGSGQGEVLMSRTLYDRHFDDPGIGGLGLYLAPGVAIEEALREVRATIAAASGGAAVHVSSNLELRELSMRIFDRTFTITEVLRLLAVGVAIIGILGALMALQLERQGEFGVLRALGFTPGQVCGMVTLQTGLMGLIAGLIALPTGILLASLLIHVINERSFGWSMQMQVAPEVLLGGLLLAVCAALVSGLLPGWKMSRTSPAAALRED